MTENDTPTTPMEHNNQLLEEKAFTSRTVLIFGAITDVLALDTVRRLVALDDHSSEAITVFVSSPGGHVESGDAVHDMLKFIRSPVNMVGTGWVGSAAAHIYLGVSAEHRFCLPNTRFLIHQPSGGIGGSATDIAIQAREIVRIRERIAKTIARATGNALEQVRKDIDRDHWLSADEAVEYGLASRIINSANDMSNHR